MSSCGEVAQTALTRGLLSCRALPLLLGPTFQCSNMNNALVPNALQPMCIVQVTADMPTKAMKGDGFVQGFRAWWAVSDTPGICLTHTSVCDVF